MSTILPRAKTAYFYKNTIGGIFFNGEIEKDSTPPDDETGYKSAAFGDSGSPYFVTTAVRKGKLLKNYFLDRDERSVLIAVQSNVVRHRPDGQDQASHSLGDFLKHGKKKCRMIATKISPEISGWLKTMIGIK